MSANQTGQVVNLKPISTTLQRTREATRNHSPTDENGEPADLAFCGPGGTWDAPFRTGPGNRTHQE
eukprot:6431437-Pyramimonas_sp.AAC.1